MTKTLAIVLAAGEGTRMKSALPKVMHTVGGLPMVGHVVRTARAAGADAIAAVIGPNHDAVEKAVRAAADDVIIGRQVERLGTGHAVRQVAEAYARAEGSVIVLYADNPLVTTGTVRTIGEKLASGADIVVVGFEPADPTGYGRLLTENGRLIAIREHKDATEAERAVGLCNSGIMGFKAEALRGVIDRIGNANAKGEYYLTDAVEIAHADGLRIDYVVADADEVIGVDDRVKLSKAEAIFQNRKREEIMRAGVTLVDPATVYFSHDTQIAQDVTVEPGVWFGPGVVVESDVVIHAYSHLEGATVRKGASVGPFARLRPEAVLGENAKIGNFVEVKKADIGAGAKVSHLSYIGDATIGAETNVGAGVITVNYDGFNKAQTIVGEGAFIGSNSSLVAPVTVGAGALVASGSVITEDVEADALALGRARQIVKPGRAKDIFARAAEKKKNKGK